MGSVHISGAHFLESICEHIGCKAGVALGRSELDSFFEAEGLDEFVGLAADQHLRIESSIYEGVIEGLLYKLGRLENRHNVLPAIAHFHKYKHDDAKMEVVFAINDLFLQWSRAAIAEAKRTGAQALDPRPLYEAAAKQFGAFGLELSIDILQGYEASRLKSLFTLPAQKEWKETIELRALFESERLNAEVGQFFDQRYIDYLNRNFDDIDNMHWRKFEELTAEFFQKAGYEVKLGPGRNDDGVDVRAWSSDMNANEAPQIVIQCKREKKKIGKVVVKSLYADVLHEQASSGLIVTTSHLTPGAQKTCTARNYPVGVIDRPMLRTWLSELRKPGIGIVM